MYLVKGSVKVSKERLETCEKAEEGERVKGCKMRETRPGEKNTKKKEPTGGHDESSSHGRRKKPGRKEGLEGLLVT